MTNDEALNSLRALDKHFKEQFPGNGYPAIDWAIREIERLRIENQHWKDISDGWWQFHIGKISPEEMCGLLLKVDPIAKRPIPGYYDSEKVRHG